MNKHELIASDPVRALEEEATHALRQQKWGEEGRCTFDEPQAKVLQNVFLCKTCTENARKEVRMKLFEGINVLEIDIIWNYLKLSLFRNRKYLREKLGFAIVFIATHVFKVSDANNCTHRQQTSRKLFYWFFFFFNNWWYFSFINDFFFWIVSLVICFLFFIHWWYVSNPCFIFFFPFSFAFDDLRWVIDSSCKEVCC